MPFHMDIRDPCTVTPHIVAVLVLFVVSTIRLLTGYSLRGRLYDDMTYINLGCQ